MEAFLGGRIPFLAIPRIVGQALDRTANFEPSDLEAVLGADAEARRGRRAGRRQAQVVSRQPHYDLSARRSPPLHPHERLVDLPDRPLLRGLDLRPRAGPLPRRPGPRGPRGGVLDRDSGPPIFSWKGAGRHPLPDRLVPPRRLRAPAPDRRPGAPRGRELGRAPRSCRRSPTRLKMLVFVAGATFNILFAFVLACVIWVVGQPENDEIAQHDGSATSRRTIDMPDGSKVAEPRGAGRPAGRRRRRRRSTGTRSRTGAT